MYERLEEADDPDNPDPETRTYYTNKWTVDDLEAVVRKSLSFLNTDVATESMRQKFLQSLGTLRRKASQNVRYTPIIDRYFTLSTRHRQSDSVSAAELRHTKTIFYTDQTRASLINGQIEFFNEVIEPGSGFKVILVENRHDLKTPLNLIIADSENERKFIYMLRDPNNITHYEAWIKSTATRFYEIDFAWKKGEHPKRGKFNPDFFIKVGDLILVIEIKGDEELREPSEENRKKNEYAQEHFKRVNAYLKAEDSPIRYKFHFLTPLNFNTFFQELRDGRIAAYRSDLDVKLIEEI